MRRLCQFISLLSFLLSLATAALWARSGHVEDLVGFDTVERIAGPGPNQRTDHFSYALISGKGELTAVRRRGTFGMPPKMVAALPQNVGERSWTWRTRQNHEAAIRVPATALERLGVSREHVFWGHRGNIDAVDSYTAPHWAVLCVFLILPFRCIAASAFNRA
ncbi:MAG TPA: hypothetical protein VFC78_04125 [Tepidisphaeraceae bacterium]|nr:hypothetical protein [Tepidisphaeraceae bacterium]